MLTRNSPKTGNTNFRIASGFALVLLFHRLLHRFLTRLRASLLLPSAKAFRRRNPRVAAALTSRYTPAVGAGLAGMAVAWNLMAMSIPNNSISVDVYDVVGIAAGIEIPTHLTAAEYI